MPASSFSEPGHGVDELNYNLRLRHPDAMDIMRDWQRRSAIARRQMSVLEDLAYGESEWEKLDIFMASPSAPLLVFIHGGYWQGGDKRDVSFVAAPFVRAGVTVALINYGLAPDTPIEAMLAQTARAVRWLHANAAAYGVDAQRIHLMGHSAGGHLAAAMLARTEETAAMSRLVRSATAISGLFDLAPLIATSWNMALRLDERRAALSSPARLERNSDAPLFTLVGADETEGFKQQAASIGQSWSKVRSLPWVTDKHHYNVLDIFDGPSNPWLGELLGVVAGVRG